LTLDARNEKPTTIVIFGASGDLTARKLMPALFNQHRKRRLPANTRVVGYARRPYTLAEFQALMLEEVTSFAGVPIDPAVWYDFSSRLFYARGDLDTPADYASLHACLAEIEGGPANRLYYLATAPEFYPAIVTHLCAAGMSEEQENDVWRRVIIEKPFGHDQATARHLNDIVHRAFRERQVYRIDHYLGKETAQNILFFRFANSIFEPIWNRNYIDHVEITVAEAVDVGHRAGYYDQAGVLRDMFQNHLLQLLALVAMEPPVEFEATAVRNEKMKVLSALQPIPLDRVADYTVRAQYEHYRDERGVAPDSQTPTYAALRLQVDNWRWQGVPFYLRSGKALKTKLSEVVIQFRSPPHVLFNRMELNRMRPNVLVLGIQPDEGMRLTFETKVPDSPQATRSVDMEFNYSSSFGDDAIPEAYERLLLDAILGDASLFIRGDEIDRAWGLIDSILAGWASPHAPPLVEYPRGSWGPAESKALLARDGRAWREYINGKVS
jgi:glucose-6-phosphate 1-dehydrogenase